MVAVSHGDMPIFESSATRAVSKIISELLTTFQTPNARLRHRDATKGYVLIHVKPGLVMQNSSASQHDAAHNHRYALGDLISAPSRFLFSLFTGLDRHVTPVARASAFDFETHRAPSCRFHCRGHPLQLR